MKAAPTPFEPGAFLARVVAVPDGYLIDCRGPYGARRYDFVSLGDVAEFAIALRDEGSWPLRFGVGTEPVRELVDELSEGDPA